MLLKHCEKRKGTCHFSMLLTPSKHPNIDQNINSEGYTPAVQEKNKKTRSLQKHCLITVRAWKTQTRGTKVLPMFYPGNLLRAWYTVSAQ